MTNFEKTMEVCEKYLLDGSPFVVDAYRKEEGSSSEGFIYRYQKDGFMIMVDMLVDKSTLHVIVDAYAGIETINKGSEITRQLLCEYCQLYSKVDEPGFLCVSEAHGCIQYHISTPIENSVISRDTLDWLNSCAWEKLKNHSASLELLAGGHFPEAISLPMKTGDESSMEAGPFPLENLRVTMKNIPDQLRDSNHNVIGRNIRDNTKRLFLDQIMLGNMTMYRELWMNDSGCIIVAVRSELKLPKMYRNRRLTAYVNEINSSRKVTGIHALTDDGYIWISAAVSLWNGPVNGETIERLSMILYVEMVKHHDIFLEYVHDHTTTKQNGDLTVVSSMKRPCHLLETHREITRTTFEDLFGQQSADISDSEA